MSAEDHMNLSINGQSQVPPGFRFHPTEEELLHYYLRKKVSYERIDLDVIREVDLNKLEPWDIQEKCKIGSTPQNDWYFFSHKDKKYPTGTRTNRATAAGFWKATGRDKIIYSGIRRIGLRKTLVFYKGRAPHGQKSDWIMHEYRLDESSSSSSLDTTVSSSIGESMSEDGWVVCRVFKKKNYQKALESPKSSYPMDSSNNQMLPGGMRNDGVVDQILLYMGRTSCKLENHDSLHDRFMHLPRLESQTSLPSLAVHFDHDRSFKACYHDQTIDDMLIETDHQQPSPTTNQPNDPVDHDDPKTRIVNDWATIHQLVASQLNGHEDTSKHLSCFGDPNMAFCSSPPSNDEDLQLSYPYLRPGRISQNQPEVYNSENDLWSFTKSSPSPSSSDPLCHLSV